jgi:hypothetical protein
VPGVSDKTVTWSVTDTGTASESIWLAFDNSNGEWSAVNTLGSYWGRHNQQPAPQ